MSEENRLELKWIEAPEEVAELRIACVGIP
jgi:hypothetical protein